MVMRYDSGSLKKSRKLGNGHLRVDAHVTRVGVFEYMNADGTTRRELRTPEEVFRADSLESFELVPVTNDHPPGLLDASNSREFARGAVGDTVRRDGDFVRASITVYDAELVRAMESGKVEISCGYTCDLDTTPGEHRVYGRYDAKQINIRGNHVAVVDSGRAGPEVRARMDAGGAAMVAGAPSHKETPRMDTVKLKINGVEFDVPTQVAQAIQAEAAGRADASEKARKDAADAVTRADVLAGELVAVKADLASKVAALASATDPSKVQAAVAARVELETTARKHLPASTKLDGMSDRAVKVAVIKAISHFDVASTEGDGYVDGAFAGALRSVGTNALNATRQIVADASNPTVDVEEAARARMLARLANGGKDPA